MQKIIVRMRGGLGNQLFILAFAYQVISYIKNDEYELILDNREYETYKTRNFEILGLISNNKIRLYNDIEDKSIKYEITRKLYHIIQKFQNQNQKMSSFLSQFGLLYSKRSASGFQINNISPIYIYGYFQDATMAFNVKNQLMKDIHFSNAQIKSLFNHPCISVSIRCGQDYIKQGWPIAKSEYFKKAINNIIQRKYNNQAVNILIFTDDIDKAKKMSFEQSVTFVENKSALEQLEMMSFCNDFVISNSSFSWWGAFLGLKDNSIVIAPEKWYSYKEKTKDTLLMYKHIEILN